ncbi:MAG: ATP-binding cassette domain-containing protein [Gordonia sp. (in: high G+C Gram-positive bacteria)]
MHGVSVTVPTGPYRRDPAVRVLHDVSLTIPAGAVTALVGESGCGKSMAAAALCGLLPPGARFDGEVRIGAHPFSGRLQDLAALRGTTIGLVPQSPATGFTPVRTLGSQLDEVVRVLDGPRSSADLCRLVELPGSALDRYPHELSGGMAQRAALAAALAGAPEVLIADEPTSALDPDLADHVWGLLARVAAEGAAVLVITHDLAALRRSEACRSIAVMRRGRMLGQRENEEEWRRLGSSPHSASARPPENTSVELTDEDHLTEFFREGW